MLKHTLSTEDNQRANDVDEQFRRTARLRRLPQMKFSDMHVTYPVTKSSHSKPTSQSAETVHRASQMKRKKRSSKTDLWLHRPKSSKIDTEVLCEPEAAELVPKNVSPIQVKDLSTIPVLSEEEISCLGLVETLLCVEHNETSTEGISDVSIPSPVEITSMQPVLDSEEVVKCDLTHHEAVDHHPSSPELLICQIVEDEVEASISGSEIFLPSESVSIEIPNGSEHLVETAPMVVPTVETNVLQVQMSDGSVVYLQQGVVSQNDQKWEANDSEVNQVIVVNSDGQPQNEKNNDILFKCAECPYKTDKAPNWMKHLLKHKKKKAFTCDLCSFKCSTSSNLQRHKLTHTDEKRYKCGQCDKAFRQKAHLCRHMKILHPVTSFKCPECSFVCASIAPTLTVHLKEEHGIICSEKLHKPSKIPKNTEGAVYYCEECNFGPAAKKVIQQHMKLHGSQGSEMKFFCEHCSFLTQSKSRFERHMLVHSGEKPFACGHCEYQSSQKTHVLRHMRLLHGFVMPAIRKTTRKDPTEEPRIHAGSVCPKEKHFLCNFCTMTFTKLINLRKHVMVQHEGLYTPDQPGQYSCVMCSYTTGHWNNLLVHMRKHSFQTVKAEGSNLAFTCVLCPFSCSSRNLLHEHMNTEHKVNVDSPPSTKASPCVQIQIAPGAQYTTVEIDSPSTVLNQEKTDDAVNWEGNYVEMTEDVCMVESVEEENQQ